jgi:hypothetical protein
MEATDCEADVLAVVVEGRIARIQSPKVSIALAHPNTVSCTPEIG